ncbi:molybdenum ABC transporter substrate-binding protein [Ruegeria marisrubri]|uniref:Molybdate-binding protein ModA n=1 Tax=Ruegeria marisrubri TaxID=1685379 RepID=A0A0X3TC01_9RHOB|nr:molybdate ABC transporter substrate-binding protein [Ruegeria marisrubri]KUJ73317.1 molybdenum ABC transporter substrate-binding protein [Ruegeria marisrubri]
MSPCRACRSIVAALVALAALTAPARAVAEEVLVFAAASLETALELAAEEFEADTGHEVTASYAGSSVLARQIQAGAPADLFLSANQEWMDVLEAAGLVAAETRVDLLGNSLVLIGRSGGGAPVVISPGFDLAERLEGGALAMALVDAVPAGIYGKAALRKFGLWEQVAGSVAQAVNVRAALALVSSGAAPLGIVYASDAMADDRVQVIARFPGDSHAPIVYPAAATVTADDAALDFLSFLQGDAARRIFVEQGFTLPGE